MTPEPAWVSLDAVLLIHEVQIRRFGGSTGLRDPGLLESALARPQQIYCYSENATLTQLAAALALGIIRNHPFIEWNQARWIPRRIHVSRLKWVADRNHAKRSYRNDARSRQR